MSLYNIVDLGQISNRRHRFQGVLCGLLVRISTSRCGYAPFRRIPFRRIPIRRKPV